MRKSNNRIIKINEEIKRELSQIMRSELKDPRIHPMTSVVRVDTTPDLKYCKVYVSVLANDEESKNTIDGLVHSTGYIKNKLAKLINLRNTPEMTFILDQSIEYGIEMSKKIDQLKKQEKGEE